VKLSEEINRDQLIQFLATKNIPAMVYYPVPAHQQKMFTNIPSLVKNMKYTEWLSQRVISLPMHTELTTKQQDFIIENITNFLKN
jgi:dTDP-4-amino-4,6-dideoxygalactose transaminase